MLHKRKKKRVETHGTRNFLIIMGISLVLSAILYLILRNPCTNPDNPREVLGVWLNPSQNLRMTVEDWPAEVKSRPEASLKICGSKTATLAVPVKVSFFPMANVDNLLWKFPNYGFGGVYTVGDETYLIIWYDSRLLIFDTSANLFVRMRMKSGKMILQTAALRDYYCMGSASDCKVRNNDVVCMSTDCPKPEGIHSEAYTRIP